MTLDDFRKFHLDQVFNQESFIYTIHYERDHYIKVHKFDRLNDLEYSSALIESLVFSNESLETIRKNYPTPFVFSCFPKVEN